VQPDRPYHMPEDRIVYLPIRVQLEGLADDTNGPYFKGWIRISPAQQPFILSISESEVLTREQIVEMT